MHFRFANRTEFRIRLREKIVGESREDFDVVLRKAPVEAGFRAAIHGIVKFETAPGGRSWGVCVILAAGLAENVVNQE